MLVGGYFGALGATALGRQFGGGPAAALAPAITLWNPFVAERLLQGHWSVVLAGVLLPAVALTAMRRTRWSLPGLVALMAVSALTPTGLILTTVTALAAGLAGAKSVPRLLTVAAAGTVLSLPWAVSTLIHAGAGATLSDSAGAALFAARAESGVGTLGALAGLGGIWNAEAVPASREFLGPLSTGAGMVLAVTAVTVAVLLGRRRQLAATPLLVLALVAVVVPAALATSPGLAVTGWLLEHVPGAGLVRDTQKFVVLAVPGLIILLSRGLGLAAGHGRGVTAGAAAVVFALVWVSVPALPRDIADVAPVTLEPGYDRAAAEVAGWRDGASPRTLLWPPGNYRMIEGRPALDPALKMLPGSPVDPGYLIVDGTLVDGDPGTVAALNDLATGEDTLAARGIDLVLVDGTDDTGGTGAAAGVLAEHREIWSDGRWSLYAVAGCP